MAATIQGPRLVLLGRQGAGKGTQGAKLATHLGVAHMATGTILRQAVEERSPLGRRVGRYLNQGRLVPNELILHVVGEKLESAEIVRRGFLLDGFPRTKAQAEALVELLGERKLDAAVLLDVPTEVVRRRLEARRVCRRCDTPTVAANGEDVLVCPACGGLASRRQDDNAEAIDQRLATYEEQTGPAITLFERLGLLVKVDALGAPDEVFERLLRGLRPALWGTGEAVG
jgi:adenylate kinase